MLLSKLFYLPGESHGISHCVLLPTLLRKEKNIFNQEDQGFFHIKVVLKNTVSYKANSGALYEVKMKPLLLFSS